jgi:hypothetical protein
MNVMTHNLSGRIVDAHGQPLASRWCSESPHKFPVDLTNLLGDQIDMRQVQPMDLRVGGGNLYRFFRGESGFRLRGFSS